MEEKYKKFLEFNWRECAEWHQYFSNIFPTPPGKKVEHYKKKFYQRNIDPDFDVQYVPNEQRESAQPNTTYQARTPNYSTMAGSNSILVSYMEMGVWLLFIVSIFFKFHTLKLSALALLLRVYRRIGFIKFNMEYAQLLFLDEHFQLILYSLLFLIDRVNLFVLVPLMITAALNLSDIVRSIPKLRQSLPLCDKILNKRVELALMRSKIELAIGGLLILGIFFGLNSLLTPVFYWQYLRFKYIVNEDTKSAFGYVSNILNNFKRKPFVPGPVVFVIDKIQQFASFLGRNEPAPGQRAGGMNCSIF